MSKIFFSVLFLFPFISEAQSLKDAKRYFENYEYALAASSYESFSELTLKVLGIAIIL